MRLCSSGRLIGLLAACFASLPATAQPCGENINGHEIAIGLEKSISNATVTLYDPTGAPMRAKMDSPFGAGLTEIPLFTRAGYPCAAFIDFPGHGDVMSPNVITYEYPGRIVTLVFSYLGEGGLPRTYRIVYGGTSATYGCETLGGTFFCPYTSAASYQDFAVLLEPTRVRVSPTYMWNGTLPDARWIDETVPDDDWVLPYQGDVVCAGNRCGTSYLSDSRGSGLFLMPVDAVVIAGQPFTKRIGRALSLRSDLAFNWTDAWLRLAFNPDGRLSVSSPSFDVNGMTFTAWNPAAGWTGVRFNPGSGGAWTGATVERVVGDPISGATSDLYAATVSVTGASPTFTDVTLQNPVAGTSVAGLAVSGAAGYTTAPVLVTSNIFNMTAQGVTVNGAARLDVRRGEITGTAGTALATGGAGTQAFLVPVFNGTNTQGPGITANGGGVFASGGSQVRFGTSNAAAPGFGLASVTNNSGRGIQATGGSSVYAGSGTVASGAYQRNRVYGNGGTTATGNSFATGTGSRVFARCDWWNTTTPSAFRVGGASGGLVDASYYLLQDPYAVANPACTNLSIDLGRSAGGADGRAAALAGRGTPAEEASALDRLAEAMTETNASDALGQFGALVADLPETEAAAAALGEVAVLAARADALPAATALLTASTASAHGALRVAAWQGLVASRRARGDRAGALAATDALAAEGGAALVPAETARVYLHAEAG